MKRKRKIKPMSVRWEDRLWPILNKLRGELINKEIYSLPMTLTEKADLETLQAYADYYINRRFPPMTRRLNRMMAKLQKSAPGVRGGGES